MVQKPIHIHENYIFKTQRKKGKTPVSSSQVSEMTPIGPLSLDMLARMSMDKTTSSWRVSTSIDGRGTENGVEIPSGHRTAFPVTRISTLPFLLYFIDPSVP